MLRENQLAKILKDNPEVNDAEESYVSFIANARPDRWDYKREAVYLLKLLEALQNANLITIC